MEKNEMLKYLLALGGTGKGGVAPEELEAALSAKADGTALAALDEKLRFLWKMAKGAVWDTQTDSTAAYQKTVPSGAVSAEIDSIGGKTVRRNQMAPNGNFASTAGWELFSSNAGTFTAADNVGTFTALASESAQQGFKQTFTLDKSHRYFAHVEIRRTADCAIYAALSPDSINANRFGSFSSSATVGSWETAEAVLETLSADNNTGARFSSYGTRVPEGESVSVRNFMVFDLTELFGASYSKSGVAEVKADLAAIGIRLDAYIPTSATAPVHAAVTGVVSRDGDAETLGTLEIPAAVRALEGYGQSEVGGDGNTLNLADGAYTEIGHYVDGVWTLLDAPVVTDVSALLPDNMLETDAGGTLTFVSEAGAAVPNSVDYLVKLSEAEA